MFLIGIRDKAGMRMALTLAGMWIAATAVMLMWGKTLSLIALAFDICVTAWFARSFWKIRESLEFNGAYYRDFLIPHSALSNRVNAIVDLVCLIFMFFPGAVSLINILPGPAEPLEQAALVAWFLLGHFGLLGICVYLFRKPWSV